MASTSSPRKRIRDVIPNLPLGLYPPGPLNSLTDVPGVLVNTESIRSPKTAEHHEVNTGVTTILPRKNCWTSACHAGIHRFNGAGEMTGTHMIAETGLLCSPIIITGTFGIGAAHEGTLRHLKREHSDKDGLLPFASLPVVAETCDAYLTDLTAFPVKPEHIVRGIDAANDGPVQEGCTGGGTGMICHWFKAGTGSASRRVPVPGDFTPAKDGLKEFTLGCLVQANYGSMNALRIGGVPVGLQFAKDNTGVIFRSKKREEPKPTPGDGSIIIILATDAPLHPIQLQRLAQRATVGLARVGGNGNNYSGDIFLAFSTAADIAPFRKDRGVGRTPLPEMLEDEDLNDLFVAAADVVEESIYNALCMAESTTGPLGQVADPIDLDEVKRLVEPRLLVV